jgi:glutamate transport system substrate-binding protein
MSSTCRATVCALAISLTALAACSSSTPTPSGPSAVSPTPTVISGSVLARIKKRGRIIVGVKFDVPLFGFKDPKTGTLEGFDIRMAVIVANAIFGDQEGAARIEFVEALSKNREGFLQEGKVDIVLSTYTITESRKQLVDFAGPYYVAGQDILAKTEDVKSGRIAGIATLNGKKVCAVTGSTSLTNLKTAAPQADTAVTKERYSECFEALKSGQVEAMSTDDVILLGLSQASKGAFSLAGNPFHTEPYGVGIPKGETDLKTLVNQALQTAFEDGSWAKAFAETVGTVGASTPSAPTLDP